MKLSRRNIIIGTAALAGFGPGLARAQDLSTINDPPPNGEMVMGQDTAKVTVIEYASATCPHCATFHTGTFQALKTEYIDTGKVRFVFREFPHNDAAHAAFMVARCAPKEKYFPIMDAMFKTQAEWTQNPLEGLAKIAQQAGMSRADFDACLKNEAVAKAILDSRTRAEGYGVDSIPTFFVNGERYNGDTSIEAFRAKIDPLLA